LYSRRVKYSTYRCIGLCKNSDSPGFWARFLAMTNSRSLAEVSRLSTEGNTTAPWRRKVS
jgi:hypothetical protein